MSFTAKYTKLTKFKGNGLILRGLRDLCGETEVMIIRARMCGGREPESAAKSSFCGALKAEGRMLRGRIHQRGRSPDVRT